MLGKRLKKLREEKGLSQIELGKILNIANSTLSMYESNSRQPDYNTLQKLANFFGVTTDYLLGRSNIKGIHAKIKNAISDDPELLEFWNEMTERDNLQILFKQVKDLPDESIKRIIRYVKIVEDEEALEDN